MSEKESRIKTHFRKHKNKYLAGITIVGVGTSCFYIGKMYGCSLNAVDNSNVLSNKAVVNVKPTNIQRNKNTYITNITHEVSRPGNAGNIVYCPELDRVFSSQTEAERECKLSRGTVSKVINGVLDKSKGGLTFKKIGDFNSDTPRSL